MSRDLRYTPSLFAYRRRPTRVVMVGDVAVGGGNPIRIQSMTTTPTYEVEATVDQIERLAKAGCEIARVTVPSKRDGEALPEIRAEMQRRGLTNIPLVADIHFNPALAMASADHVEKVRINPGNYVDSKRFQVREYSDAEYQEELDRIDEAFTPLVLKLKRLGRALRIGTNHGSLSDRILNRYGDTPQGMVESALEFVRICRRHDYHAIIISMKASNPLVMIQAYRLLAARMTEEDMDYPFHLGVTEAGGGIDGRVKSALGIGALLLDGIGDTIRVSLTENPVAEVPVGFALAELFSGIPEKTIPADEPDLRFDPFQFERRESARQSFGELAYGGGELPRVELDIGAIDAPRLIDLAALRGDDPIELVSASIASLEDLSKAAALPIRGLPLSLRLAPELWRAGAPRSLPAGIARLELEGLDLGDELAAWVELAAASKVGLALSGAPAAMAAAVSSAQESGASVVARLEVSDPRQGVEDARALAAALESAPAPILLDWRGQELDPVLGPSAILGGILCDGIGDALRVPARGPYSGHDPVGLAYTLLQAARLRTTKTEFISCPSCGRTLFDLEETTAKIQELTGHLPNVKIAIMGCIVNGPGEMADADFGYVGWKPGKVDLWVGKEVVEKAIPEAQAPGRLVELLKRHGVWREPATAEASQDRGLPVL